MANKVAVVTGSNKGVGFATVRALCKKFDGDVYLTARDEGRGQEALAVLKAEGLNPQFHQLDINNHESIVRLRDFLKEKYGGLDVLVNNAGIMLGSKPLKETARETCETNYFATLDACNVLFPILKTHARVCHVSGGLAKGALSKCSVEKRQRFVDPSISMEELSSLINQFIEAAEKGDNEEQGFASSAYGMSKVAVTVMNIVQQREMDATGAEDIVINCVCPGWTASDMGGSKAGQGIDQGAEMSVHCALLPPDITSPRGQFVQRDRETGKPSITLWNMDTTAA